MSRKGTRIVAALAGLALLFVVAACGGSDTPTPTQPSQGGGTPTATAPSQSTPTPAFDAEAYFRGKTITLVVGFNPGGGTDTQARFLATNLAKFIPGNPTINVSNITPNVAAMNFVWNSAPDGFTIVYTATSNISESLDANAEFRTASMGFIGSPHARNVVWWIQGDLPYDNVEDAIGSTGPELTLAGEAAGPEETTGATVLGAMMVADWLNLPLRYAAVAGTGTQQTLLMLERGDTNGAVLGNLWHTMPQRQPGWLADGFIRNFANLSHPTTNLPNNGESDMDAPNVRDLFTDEQRAIWDGIIAPDTFVGKTLLTPPNIDPNVLEVLRQAWVDMLKDAEIVAEYERLIAEPIQALNGEEGQQLFREVEDAFYAQADQIAAIQERVHARFVR